MSEIRSSELRLLFSHLLIWATLLSTPVRAADGDEPDADSVPPPTVATALGPEITPEKHFKWNDQGRTIWELFGVQPGELEDDVQDRKRDLMRGGAPDSIVNEAWPLIKQDGFSKFYAGFVLAFGGTDSFKLSSGSVHVLVFNRYYKTYKVQPISLLWNVSEKLEKLAEMLEDIEDFSEIYGPAEIKKIREYAQKLRENRATELRQSGRRWFQGETWQLAAKSKYLFGIACVGLVALASYHKGASDYAPKPSEVIQQRHDPLPAATDVRSPAQTQAMQKAADEAAVKRGEEARKLFDME